jgi:ABC-type branched-subunit amino acid transport system ATPase component
MTGVGEVTVGTALLDAQHIQKFAYDDEGRPIRGTDVLLLADARCSLWRAKCTLIGENGAGKTTHQGHRRVPYEAAACTSTASCAARRPSPRCVRGHRRHLAGSLAPHLSVVENMFLGRGCDAAGDWTRAR